LAVPLAFGVVPVASKVGWVNLKAGISIAEVFYVSCGGVCSEWLRDVVDIGMGPVFSQSGFPQMAKG